MHLQRGHRRIALCAGLVCALAAAAQDQPADAEHPPVIPATPKPADLNRGLLNRIEDDQPVRGRGENGGHEALAYEYLFSFARQVAPADMAKAARTDLTFANLFGPDRDRYRGQVVRLTGTLLRVRRFEPPKVIEAEGVTDLYEAWLIPDGAGNNPACMVFSELPAGIAVGESQRRAVTADAFFFKRYRYAAGDGARLAPLLIGRTLSPAATPASDAVSSWLRTGQTAAVIVGVLVVAALVLAGLTMWYRVSDRKAKAALDAARGRGDDEPFIGLPPFERTAFDSEPSHN